MLRSLYLARSVSVRHKNLNYTSYSNSIDRGRSYMSSMVSQSGGPFSASVGSPLSDIEVSVELIRSSLERCAVRKLFAAQACIYPPPALLRPHSPFSDSRVTFPSLLPPSGARPRLHRQLRPLLHRPCHRLSRDTDPCTRQARKMLRKQVSALSLWLVQCSWIV